MDNKDKIPDGGYGWIIVCGSFLLNFVVVGMPRGFGVMYVILTERFDSTATETAWVHALYNTSRMLLAPVTSYMCDRFTTRKVVLVGSALIFIGVTSSAFVTSIYQMYFTYGIVAGIGGSMLFAPSLIIVGEYFSSKKGTAMGVSSIGAGVGTMAFAAMFTYVIDYYGYLGGMLIIGGVVSHCAIAGALFRPLAQHLEFCDHSRAARAMSKTTNNCKPLTTEELQNSTDLELELKNGIPKDGQEETLNSKESETNVTNDVGCTSLAAKEMEISNNDKDLEVALKNNIPFLGGEKGTLNSDPQSALIVEDTKVAVIIEETKMPAKPSDDITALPWINRQLTLLTNKAYLSYMLAIMVMPCGIMVVVLFIAAHGEQHGLSEQQRALLISIEGLADIAGRVTFGFVFDLKPICHRRRYLHGFVGIWFGMVTMCIAPAHSFWALATVCVFHGFVEGAYHAQRATVLSEILPRQQLSMSIGYMTFFQGIGNLAFPLLGGQLRDHLGSFDAIFLIGGAILTIGSLINLLTYVFTTGGSSKPTCWKKTYQK